MACGRVGIFQSQWARVSFGVTIFVLSNFHFAGAQNSLITLVDSTKVKADIEKIAKGTVFTSSGSFNITEIYSVRFLTPEEYQKNRELATNLLDFGVTVYVLQVKLKPSDPATVAANRKLREDEIKPPATRKQWYFK